MHGNQKAYERANDAWGTKRSQAKHVTVTTRVSGGEGGPQNY